MYLAIFKAFEKGTFIKIFTSNKNICPIFLTIVIVIYLDFNLHDTVLISFSIGQTFSNLKKDMHGPHEMFQNLSIKIISYFFCLTYILMYLANDNLIIFT